MQADSVPILPFQRIYSVIQDSIFEDAQWLHISGVTPAISENTALCTKRAFEEAKKAGSPHQP